MKKKIVKYAFFYFILALITYILHTTLFKWLAFKGVSPNLFIAVIVSVSLLRGRDHGAIVGLLLGLFCDAFRAGPFGYNTILYMNVGFFSGYLHNYFYKESLMVPVLLMAFMSFIVNFIRYFFGFVFRGKMNMLSYIDTIFIPDLLYTAFVGFIVYNILYLIFIIFTDKNKEARI